MLRLPHFVLEQMISPGAGQQAGRRRPQSPLRRRGQHMVHIGRIRRRAGRGGHAVHRQPGRRNEPVVQGPFHGRHHPLRQLLQQVGIGRLRQRQRHGPPEPLQVVIILPQVVLKSRQRQAAVLDFTQERVRENRLPDGLRLLAELFAETGHCCLSPRFRTTR